MLQQQYEIERISRLKAERDLHIANENLSKKTEQMKLEIEKSKRFEESFNKTVEERDKLSADLKIKEKEIITGVRSQVPYDPAQTISGVQQKSIDEYRSRKRSQSSKKGSKFDSETQIDSNIPNISEMQLQKSQSFETQKKTQEQNQRIEKELYEESVRQKQLQQELKQQLQESQRQLQLQQQKLEYFKQNQSEELKSEQLEELLRQQEQMESNLNESRRIAEEKQKKFEEFQKQRHIGELQESQRQKEQLQQRFEESQYQQQQLKVQLQELKKQLIQEQQKLDDSQKQQKQLQ
jgi:hypothetical protein